MAYHVNLSVRARNDLRNIYDRVEVVQSTNASLWYWGLVDAINSLENRCPAMKEDSNLKQLLYGHRKHIYRIIYRIVKNTRVVAVLHIRHAARSELIPQKL